MAEHVEFTPHVSPADIEELVTHLREADRIECAAAGVLDVRQAITQGVARSALCWAVRVDGELACILGVVPLMLLGDTGVVWLLGTDVISRNARALMRLSPPYIEMMLLAYPHLANHVHAANRQAVRWLTRMGFTLHAPVRASTGELFYPFEKRA